MVVVCGGSGEVVAGGGQRLDLRAGGGGGVCGGSGEVLVVVVVCGGFGEVVVVGSALT